MTKIEDMTSEELAADVALSKAGAERERKELHRAINAFGKRLNELGEHGVACTIGELVQTSFAIADMSLPPDGQRVLLDHHALLVKNMKDIKRENPNLPLVEAARQAAQRMAFND